MSATAEVTGAYTDSHRSDYTRDGCRYVVYDPSRPKGVVDLSIKSTEPLPCNECEYPKGVNATVGGVSVSVTCELFINNLAGMRIEVGPETDQAGGPPSGNKYGDRIRKILGNLAMNCPGNAPCKAEAADGQPSLGEQVEAKLNPPDLFNP